MTVKAVRQDLENLKALVREFLVECMPFYIDNDRYNALYEQLSVKVGLSDDDVAPVDDDAFRVDSEV